MVTKGEIIKALTKYSWRLRNPKTNQWNGPVVCYPDEILMELFGKEVFDEVFFEEKNNMTGKNPRITETTENPKPKNKGWGRSYGYEEGPEPSPLTDSGGKGK